MVVVVVVVVVKEEEGGRISSSSFTALVILGRLPVMFAVTCEEKSAAHAVQGL